MRADNALDTRLRAAIEVFEAGELDRALQMVERLRHSHPHMAIVHNVHGVIAAELGAYRVAVESYQKAISLEPGNCDFHFNLGNVLRDKGDLKTALASYRAALKIRPDDPDVAFNMASVLRGLGQLNGAKKLFEQLAEVSPEDHTVHSNLGGVLLQLGQTETAIDCFRRTLKLNPGSAEAHDSLCEALENTDRIDDYRKAVAAARTACRPDDIMIVTRQARLLRDDKQLEDARKVLSAVTRFDPGQAPLNSAYWYLHGDICDRLEDARAAYAAFVEANLWAAKTAAGRGLEPEKFVAGLDDLQGVYKTLSRGASPESAAQTDAPQLVFLVGFPLSGSTLLATALRHHSRITVVAEEPMVQEMAAQAAGSPDHERLTDDQVKQLRSTYMARLSRCLPERAEAGDVVIDSLPLNIVQAGLLSRVFPDARFLLALRHPCDCVLSCFMHDFRLDDVMANFLDLKSAARCYDKVMSVWSACTSALQLPVHTVKHEQLVGDPEAVARKVLDHLDLEWEEAKAGKADTAIDHKPVAKSGHARVAQPICSHTNGRWRRYRAHMVPVLPTLLKWAEIHGYSND
ncbi:MAG: sulfotransferase [Pseudomonadota bacterium]